MTWRSRLWTCLWGLASASCLDLAFPGILSDPGPAALTPGRETTPNQSLEAATERGSSAFPSALVRTPAPARVAATTPAPRPRAAAALSQEPSPELSRSSLTAWDARPAADIHTPEPEKLLALGRETLVFARPERVAPRLGYLRAGSVVRRGQEAVSGADCPGGWYRIEPEGYVCVGPAASLEWERGVLGIAARRAERDDPLPYVYGLSRGAPGVLYSHVPTRAEQAQAEPGFATGGARRWANLPISALPLALSDHRPFDVPWGYARLDAGFERALPRSGFAFLEFYAVGGRVFGLTTDYALLAVDALQPVEPSRFQGLLLAEGARRAVVFVKGRQAHLFKGSPERGLRHERAVAAREAFSLSGRELKSQGVNFFETTSGSWLRAPSVVKVELGVELPAWAEAAGKWLDVSIEKQMLVAYEGREPIYVTLVSTGRDGSGDPETTHSTVQGRFRIHTKHVSATMDSDAAEDMFDLRDVPYVQYFTAGYALHAAYWHDDFGNPHSHGCINLAPRDARWLFQWTTPGVPPTWHGAYAKDGTSIYIHP